MVREGEFQLNLMPKFGKTAAKAPCVCSACEPVEPNVHSYRTSTDKMESPLTPLHCCEHPSAQRIDLLSETSIQLAEDRAESTISVYPALPYRVAGLAASTQLRIGTHSCIDCGFYFMSCCHLSVGPR